MIFAQGLIGGGDHDHQEHGSSKPIGGGDHDIIAHKVIQLTNMLRAKSVEDLRKYALKVEKWQKDSKQDTKGGIHDYVRLLDHEACMKYILSASLKYQELLETETFLSIVAEESLNFLAVDAEETSPKMGGLHDFIFRLERTELVNLAFSAEKFSFEVKGSTLMGGLHDTINSMSNIDIASYILEKAREHKELDNYTFLTGLTEKYGFVQPEVTVAFGAGGLHDYIFRENRATLEKWALTAEKHHRFVNNKQMLGGLHDYISALTTEEVAEFVLKEAAEHKELDSAEGLNKLAIHYGVESN
jgi:hypothetical protein